MSKITACSEKTKIRMARALRTLIIKGEFEKITVSDITDECGIHRQTFYYHFQDKYELLDWLLYRELLDPFIDGFCFDNMYDKLYDIFSKIYNDQDFYRNAFMVDTGCLNNYVSEIAVKQFTDIISRIGVENGFVKNDEESHIVAEFIGCGVTGIVFEWVRKGCRETPEELRDNVVCIIRSCKALIINRAKLQ